MVRFVDISALVIFAPPRNPPIKADVIATNIKNIEIAKKTAAKFVNAQSLLDKQLNICLPEKVP